MKWLHKIINSFLKENGWGTGQIFTLQTGFVIGKVAVQLSQSNMSCAYCLKASHSVRLNGKG